MNLLVRADGSPSVGAGHVMRCLALGQACSDRGGRVAFATHQADSPLFRRVVEESMEVVELFGSEATEIDADEVAVAARRCQADWVAVDGYRFDDGYQRSVKQAGLRLLVLDDFGHSEHRGADIVLNQNLHARASSYSQERSNLLLGPRYALLRREFAARPELPREIPDRATRVLVTLGGGTAAAAVAGVLRAIDVLGRPELRVRCVLGPLAEDDGQIAAAADAAAYALSLERASTEMPELMEWAELAVSGGGSTCWELASMGLPALLVAHNAHQQTIAESVEAAGAALFAGVAEELEERALAALLGGLLDDRVRRRRMSSAGRELVDGRGAERVARELENRLAEVA